MFLGHTIPSWPWVVSLQGITLKTVLNVHKIYHACLFFNLSLALLSQTLEYIHNLLLKSVLTVLTQNCF